MGHAIAIFYFPILIALSVWSAFLSEKFSITDELSYAGSISRIIGAIVSVAITFWVVSTIEYKNNTDFGALFNQLGISLFAPLVIGLILVFFVRIIAPSRGEWPSVLLLVNRFATGVFHGVWLVPLSYVAYMSQ